MFQEIYHFKKCDFIVDENYECKTKMNNDRTANVKWTLWGACVHIVDDEHIQIVLILFKLDSFHPPKFLMVLVQVDYLLSGLDLQNRLLWFLEKETRVVYVKFHS